MHKTSRRLISLSHTYTQIQTHVFFQILHLFTDKVWKYRENSFRGRLSRSFERSLCFCPSSHTILRVVPWASTYPHFATYLSQMRLQSKTDSGFKNQKQIFYLDVIRGCSSRGLEILGIFWTNWFSPIGQISHFRRKRPLHASRGRKFW